MGKFKIQKSATVNVGFDYSNIISGVSIGGTGGNTSITGDQIQVWANLAVSRDDAFIIKGGPHKFLVSNGNVSTTCTLVNKHKDYLLAGEMSMVAVPYSTAYFYVSKMSNKFVWDFDEPLPNKYLWTGGEAQEPGSNPLVDLPIVRIPLV